MVMRFFKLKNCFIFKCVSQTYKYYEMKKILYAIITQKFIFYRSKRN